LTAAPPQTPSWILGVLLLRERREGEGEKEGDRKGRRRETRKGGKKRGKGEEGKGKAPTKFSHPPSCRFLEICLLYIIRRGSIIKMSTVSDSTTANTLCSKHQSH